MMKRIALATLLALAASAAGQEPKPIFEGGGISVYAKADFDAGENPFAAGGALTAALIDSAKGALSGKSLHLTTGKDATSFGGLSVPVAATGPKDLKIAFCIRAKGLGRLAVNFADRAHRDNTTPVSPPIPRQDVWQTVILHVQDFRYNAGQFSDKPKPNAKFSGLSFHGPVAGGAGVDLKIDKFIMYRGDDVAPPTAPTGVKAQLKPKGVVILTWTEPRDNAFPVVYSIYRRRGPQWAKVGESMRPTFTDTTTRPGRYVYRVTAADYENNCSPPSADRAVIVSTTGKAEKVADPRVTDRTAYAANVRKIRAAGAGKTRRHAILYFGDSITAAHPYMHALTGCLGQGIGVRHGYGGQTTAFAKGKIDEFLKSVNPEFAVVMFGTNDSKNTQSVQGSMKNLAYVIDACAKHGTVPVVATIPPRGYQLDQPGERHYNAQLIKLCRMKKVPISYVFEAMIPKDLKTMLGDGVHLTSGPGNAAAGDALRKTFDQIAWALRDTCRTWKK